MANWIFRFASAGLLPALLLTGCADREEALQGELQRLGEWNDAYGEIADCAVGPEHIFAAANERRGFLVFERGAEVAPAPVGGAIGIDSLYAPGDEAYISSYLLADSLLFLKLATNLLAFDVSDPLQPVFLRTFFASGVNNVYGVHENGWHYLYYSDRSDGLSVHAFPADAAAWPAGSPERWLVEGGNPPNTMVDTFVDYENDGNDLIVQDDLIYLANGRYGLAIFRMSGPRVPMQLEELATLRLPGDAIRLDVRDGLAAVALGGDGLALVEVADPSRPYLRSLLKPGGTTLDIKLGAGHAYLANSSRGVLVVDLQDPARPLPRWQLATTYARRLHLRDGRIFVADRNEGLLILADPLR
jgi:hypothetical protein